MVKVMRSFVRGPLEPHIIGFADELRRRGYTETSAAQHVCFIAHLDRWMSAEGIGLDSLSGPVLERYLGQRRAAGYVGYRSVKALRPLLDYLAPLGVLPAEQEGVPGPVEDLLGRYRDYLLRERGLTEGTARGYVDFVRPFVATRVRGGGLDLAGISAADVTGFVLTACPGRAVGSAKLIVCGLRSLLRWLHLTGQVPTSLAAVVPSVAGWRLSTLPKGLEPDQLHRLLAACDRRTGTGLGRWPGSGWMTSTGGAGRSRSPARATGPNGYRCRPMWAPRSPRICGAAGRAPRRGAACSSGCTPRTGR